MRDTTATPSLHGDAVPTRSVAGPDEEFFQSYPELHHYTGWGGLQGIFTNNTMFASHYKHLNDDTEIEHMMEYFKQLIPIPGNRAQRRRLQSNIPDLYRKTFTRFVTPYVVSFSTHAHGTDFDRENGLLSQWFRPLGSLSGGYGRHGYAIVFDTRRLDVLMRREFERYCYTQTTLSNVVYNTGIERFKSEYASLINEAAWFLWQKTEKEYDRAEEFINRFIASTVSFKHSKWSNEHEVRIVAHPKDRSELQYIADSDPDDIKALRNRQIKEISQLGSKPIIKLFEGLGEDLPIKRIIVAPDEDQERLRQQVANLVGTKIPIHISAIPIPTLSI